MLERHRTMHPEAIAGKRTFRRFQAKYIKKGAGYAIKGQLEFSFLRVFWNSDGRQNTLL